MRRKGEPMGAMLLAQGWKVDDAARKAGCSYESLCRRLRDPSYRAEIQQYRDQMVDRTIGKLTDLGVSAVAVLARLLEAEAEYVQLGAAKEVLANLPIRAERIEDEQAAERGAVIDLMERIRQSRNAR